MIQYYIILQILFISPIKNSRVEHSIDIGTITGEAE